MAGPVEVIQTKEINGNGNEKAHTNGSHSTNGESAKSPTKNKAGDLEGRTLKHSDTAGSVGGPVGDPPKKKKEDGFFKKRALTKALSKRPLPTAFGDGTYPSTEERPKLSADLATINKKGVSLAAET
jgi:hypothetical protein